MLSLSDSSGRAVAITCDEARAGDILPVNENAGDL